MSEPDYKTPAQRIKPAELIEFLSAMNISPGCPTCKNGSFIIQGEESQDMVRTSVREYVTLSSNGTITKVPHIAFPYIFMACNNCGYIQSFSTHRINSWLNENHPDRVVK